MVNRSSDLNGDIHAGRQIELAQLIHGLGSGFENVEKSFVRANLKLIHRLFVDMRGTVHSEFLDAGREWNGSRYFGSCSFCSLDNFESRDVQKSEIEAFKADTDALSSGHSRKWLVFLIENRGQYLSRDLFEVRGLHGVGCTALGE